MYARLEKQVITLGSNLHFKITPTRDLFINEYTSRHVWLNGVAIGDIT